MTPAHRALRERTSEAHARVDAVFGEYDLCDRESYRAMLNAHLDALGAQEAALDRQGAHRIISDWSERKRTDALIADLRTLGDTRTVFGWVGSDGGQWSDAHIAGTLYVLEGSRLGGKFLARQLPPEFPRRYLDTDQPPGNWRKLLEKIDLILYESDLLDSAVEAALSAFDAFERSGRKWSMKAK